MKGKSTRRRIRPSRRKSGMSRPVVVVFLLALVCFCAYWVVNHNSPYTQHEEQKITHIEDVSDDGMNADYRNAAADLQDAIDGWLKNNDAEVTLLSTENREEKRVATGGKILWTTKELEVTPKEPFRRADLEAELGKSNHKAVLYQTDTKVVDGEKVTEYDIALFDMLDKEQVYLVAVKLYVTDPKASSDVIESVKKAIKEKTGMPSKTETKSTTDTSGQDRPSQVKGRLAIVIDDCGSNMTVLEKLNSIPIPLTYAVMPYKSHTAESAESGFAAGRQIFVHMPMQPMNVASSESVFISTDMSDSKIQSTANEIINQVPHARGVNNHQGSLATADGRVMKSVMQVMRNHRFLFLDSRTNSESVAEETASAMGVATSRNNLFIDNDADVGAIKERLRQAARIAAQNGSAIVIGHCRPNTAMAIADMVDELHSDGIDIVLASELMQ